MNTTSECYISVDIEASGPIPGDYSMLSLGACIVGRETETFYIEFKPLNRNFLPDALKVSGFDLEKLSASGIAPPEAMTQFHEWIQNAAAGAKPVFVGFNAAFDWSFVNWYFHRFLSANPFGFAPLDIKSYFMGLAGCSWNDTKSSRIPAKFQPSQPASHNALKDAQAQGEMFAKMMTATRG